MIKLNKNHPLYIEDLDYILSTKGIDVLKGKKVLITGATGLIGVCLIDALMRYNVTSDAKIKVYAVGRNYEKATSRLGEYMSNSLFTFIEQDVCHSFTNDLAVDYIIPLASNTHPLAYSQFPIETIMINVKGAEHALDLAVKCNATLLYPSSVEIYGNAKGEDVFTEDYTGQLNLSTARSCYTESKRVSEAMCQSYISERKAKVIIVRLSRIIGPTMLDTDTKASSQFINKALDGENIVLKSKGEQFYSYTYVADAVSAMLYALLHGDNGVVYNISNDTFNVRLKEFANTCAVWSGKEVVFDLPSEEEKKGFSVAMNAILDNSRIREKGWIPQYDRENAIRRTLTILKNNK